METYDFHNLIPDQSLVVSNLGTGAMHVRVLRNSSLALIYLPLPLPVTLKLDWLDSFKAFWFDPSSGEKTLIDNFAKTRDMTFTPPGYRPDWVLVLASL
jgi:hypothetical protein